MNITADAPAARYTVVYARGAAHIQGLDETPRDFGHEDAPAYTMSACSALSKNPYFWCTYGEPTADLTQALKTLEDCGRYVAKGHCKKCHKTATAQAELAPAEESYADKFERTFGL